MTEPTSEVRTAEAIRLIARPIAAPRERRWPVYLIAALGLAATTLVKLAATDAIGHGTPFLLYFLPILIGAWYGGFLVGLVTTVAAAILAEYFFVFARDPDRIDAATAAAQLAVFIAEGVGISLAAAAMRAARRRASALSREAEISAAKLSVVLEHVDEGITVQDRSGAVVYANAEAARVVGYPSAAAVMGATPGELRDRFEIFAEDGGPLPADALPGRRALREGVASERLIRFRNADGPLRWAQLRASPVRDGGEVAFSVNVMRDVTERRKLEEAARVHQEWFSTALRSIGDAVIATDAAGVVTFINPTAETLTGRAPSEVFPIFTETHPRRPAPSPVEQVIASGLVVGMTNHTVLLRADGVEIAIDDSAAPIRGSDGELVGVVLVFRDVTERRRQDDWRTFLASASLELTSSREIERHLGALARLAVRHLASWAAVDLVEPGGDIRRVALAHADPGHEALARQVANRVPARGERPWGLHRVLATGEAELVGDITPELLDVASHDDAHRAAIDQIRPRSFIGVPLRAGGQTIGVLSMSTAGERRRFDARDLSLAQEVADRAAAALDNARLFQQIERARADTEAQRGRLHDLVARAPAAIAVQRGPEHIYELVNAPYRALLGGRELIGLPVSALGLGAAELDIFDSVYRTGVTRSAPELAVELDWEGDGVRRTRYFNYTVQPTRDGSGAVDGTVTFAIDVSEQVVARQRAERASADAEVASRSKDEFLAMLGHELRNPLAPILTALHLMDAKAGGMLAREREVIERQVRHVVRLVDDLLDVSRITRGKIELRKEPTEIDEVVSRALEMAGPLLEQRGHQVAVAVERGLEVDGDPVRLAQVVANLLTNAAKYTERGGRIAIGGRRVDGAIEVSVADSGMGIAPEMLPRIFDLFVQEAQALDRAQGGLGLGLSIVKSLVALHGGEVVARSDGPGQGSEFIVRLPAAAGPAAVATASGAAAAGERRARVLVVDDNVDAAELLGDALELLGHAVGRAHDGPAGLALAETFKPDIALLDIGLPVMDGYELARRLRELPGLATVKLVAVTGYGQASDRERSREAGFDLHLVKPITLDQVEQAIEQLT